MKLIYLASPYSKYPLGREAAYQESCRKAADLMDQGYAVFCPIAHSHAIETIAMDDIKDGDWWLKQDFAILEVCNELFVYQMPGWDTSYGVGQEIEYARQLGMPIRYIPFNVKQSQRSAPALKAA